MKIRRTISIDKNDLLALKPLLDANGDNLSLALRQLIEEYKQRTDIQKKIPEDQKKMMLRNQIIENRIAALIPIPLVKWLLKKNPGVPPLGTYRVIMEKYTKLLGIESLSFENYIKMINAHLDIFGYQIRQHIELSPDPRNIRITFEGEDADHLKGNVIHYSCMLAHHPLRLKVRKIIESPGLIIIDYEQCSTEEEAYKSVLNYFGHTQSILDEIQNNFQFWRSAINIIKADHYTDVIVSRDIFLRILKSQDFSDDLNHLISIVYSTSVEDTDYKSITGFIEEICKANGLIYRVEHDDKEIKIYHKFDDKEIIRLVNETVIKTLEKAGQHFILRRGDKLTILSRKLPPSSLNESI